MKRLTAWAMAGLLVAPLPALANCSIVPGNPETAPDSRFVRSEPVAGQPVVEDLSTGFIWQGCEAGFSGSDCATGSALTFDWGGALQHAKASTYAGFSDWRLPNARELSSLIETACSSPTLNTTRFPVDTGAALWSASGVAQGPFAVYPDAWKVDFSNGERQPVAKTSLLRVRLVRGGGGLATFDAGADYTPDPISLAAREGQQQSQVVEFGPVAVSGIDTPIGVSVSGDGSPVFSINGGSFQAVPAVVRAGDLLRLRHLSASGAHLAVTSHLRVGPMQVEARSVTANDDASLSGLSLDPGALLPAFQAGTLAYSASVANPVTSVRVTATLSDPAATLEIAGTPATSGAQSPPIALMPGSNAIDVDVLAEDGVAARRYTVTVQRALASTTTSLSSNAASVLPGDPVTLTATVSGDAPTGSVRFLSNGSEIAGCAARPLSTGSPRTASCTTSALPSGEVTVRGEYSGDSANLPSSGELAQTVNTPPTLSVATSVALDEDAALDLPMSIGDAESPATALVIEVAASPGTLFDQAALAAAVAGSGAARSLRLAARADAFGAGTLSLAVVDPQGGRTEVPVAVEVRPVNDPPSASMPLRRVHPAGSAGAISVPGFASGLSVGPANEAGQTIGFEVVELFDAQGVVDAFGIDANGTLDYVLSGRSGVARLRVVPTDDGGVERGGLDRGEARVVRVFVGAGSDIETTLERSLPATDDLPAAIIGGTVNGEYRVRVRNHGPGAVSGIRVDAFAARGLSDLLWQCEPPASCQPGSGAGRVVLDAPIGVDETLSLTLSGRYRPEQFHLDLQAAATAATGVLVGTGDDRRVLVEALHPSAIFYSGME
ncbi:DUF1566 domain-containing protein [Pseudomarimonas salicorniae]|uniref:DUF1566 domain-containing protein n=1 Tax=Pseudomarimonas salicorniae TaxID=2933270 RepID=A0ABT0GM04_9GAMM|nr:DUF1566 domain-containing protein [Lysobacter sp. CAU 1642]MCK7595397.1 DUF1566 domain-containing protein [Lysobacter sp. CAU 1642]